LTTLRRGFFAARNDVIGTNRTSRNVRSGVANGGKAENFRLYMSISCMTHHATLVGSDVMNWAMLL